MQRKYKRWLLIALIAFAVLGAVAFIGFQYAIKSLKSQIEQALGPESEIGAIHLSWESVKIEDLRVHAPKGWPVEDALRAKRVVIVPDLRGLLSAKIRISKIIIEQGYISALRASDGKLRILPGILEAPVKKNGQSATVAINTIELRDNALEFFDATIRKPALKVRLEQVEATVRKLQIAPLAGRTQVVLDAALKGVNHDGKVVISGWVELATRDSDLRTKLRGVDLVALQPYLIKAAETGVRKGSLDLDLASTVRQNHLHAPGTLTLSGLALSSNGTFAGMPRQAVIGFMKNKKDQISVKFVLDGNLNDPHFSLNESLATRFASAAAETFGVSLGGIVSGLGTAGQKSMEGVGNTLKKLFGK